MLNSICQTLSKGKRKKECDDPSKRGPGRPRKKNSQKVPESPKEESNGNNSTSKQKEQPVKKKKQAEELVDRVFRKTGGGFGMPLSKKLKANAMAALYKTQSGFTVKRKGSTSSMPGMAKSDDDLRKLQKPKKAITKLITRPTLPEKGILKGKKIESTKVAKSTEMTVSPAKDAGKSEEEKKSPKPKKQIQQKEPKENGVKISPSRSFADGLGMLAKYAASALKEQPSLMAKKPKKVQQEGVLSEDIKKEEPSSIFGSSTNGMKTEHVNNVETSVTKPSPTVAEKRESEADSTHDSSLSVNKKRKPGRPRKCNPNTTPGVTETIVAKNTKNFFYQFQSFGDVVKAHQSSATEKKVKIENPSTMKPLFLDEEWLLRRSERIFLSEPSPQPSPNTSKESQKSPPAFSTPKKPPPPTPSTPSSSPKTHNTIRSKSEKAKLQKAKTIKDLTEKVKRKYNKALKNKPPKTKDNKNNKLPLTKRKEKKPSASVKDENEENGISDDSDSEFDNIPLSELREHPTVPEPRSCVINNDELVDGLRVLVFKDGLFHEGAVQGIRPPDVYGVLIDNERGNRPTIFCQEEILKEAIIDVKPGSSRYLTEGTRVCAYWSQQFSCLYPGTISKASPNPHCDSNSVSVEFDDGDSGRIPLDHIRMLPKDFPLVSYDPNPLLLIGKRRRHTTNESVDNRKSQSSITASESGQKQKRGPGRPPKIKKEEREDSDDDNDACGLDEDNDEVFTSNFSIEKIRKDRAKTSKTKEVEKSDKKKQKRRKSHEDEDSDSDQGSSGKRRKEDNDEGTEQVILPPRQLWKWSGTSTKRPGLKGKAKKEYYKAIVRGKEKIMVGDCAVFLSSGRPHLPFIGRIDSMWEAWGGQMVVKVKWFYHPEETRGGKKLQDMKGALFQSLHMDENDVQTISHKCEVVSYADYRQKSKDARKKGYDLYYLGGTYEPTIGLLKFEKDVDIM